MPRSAASISPFLLTLGAGERPLHVAEQLRLEQRFGQRAAVERHERPIAPQRIEMNGARHPLLARSRFSRDQHRAVGAGDLLDQLEDRQHLVAAADDVAELMRGAERALEQHVLLPELPLLERVADLDLQLVDVERLAEVVVRAQPHGFDRGVGRRKRRDHDAENVLVDPLGRAQHVDAAHVRHLDVGDQQVESARARARRSPRGRSRRASRRTPRAAARSTAARASTARRRRRARAAAPSRPVRRGVSVHGSVLLFHSLMLAATARPAAGRVTVVPRPGVELT